MGIKQKKQQQCWSLLPVCRGAVTSYFTPPPPCLRYRVARTSSNPGPQQTLVPLSCFGRVVCHSSETRANTVRLTVWKCRAPVKLAGYMRRPGENRYGKGSGKWFGLTHVDHWIV